MSPPKSQAQQALPEAVDLALKKKKARERDYVFFFLFFSPGCTASLTLPENLQTLCG